MRHRRRRLQRQRRKFKEIKAFVTKASWELVSLGLRTPNPHVPGQPRKYR